jgi:uncharacterized protein
LKDILPDILKKKPVRIIMNPGTEDENLKEILIGNGIKVVEACTLVLLKTGQF